MADPLRVLCAGAVQGIVRTLGERFTCDTGVGVHPQFGAVGAMKELLLAGEPCDVLIVTEAMVGALQSTGDLARGVCATIGRVRTGIAVPSGHPLPDVASPEALRLSLLAAPAIYFPDPLKATAGIHFASVIERLGLRAAVSPRVLNFPSGAVSMRELASDMRPGAIGCTQITEILYTPGIELVGALPEAFELVTVYSASRTANTAQRDLAARFIELLAGESSRTLRVEGGFELD